MKAATIWLVCVVVFLWLAVDGAFHWDEPAYLYAGGYLSLQQIFEGDFQPSGIPYFYLTRPMHIVMVYAVTSLTGPGVAGLIGVVAVCTLALTGFLMITRLILRELMPGSAWLNTAMAVGLLIPVVPYLMFKTLPESGALLFSSLAMWLLIRASKSPGPGRALVLGVGAALSVGLVLWFKGPMLLLLGSGVLAVVICGVPGGAGEPGVGRVRLVGLTLGAALVGLGLAYAGVVLAGIDPSIYTGGVSRVGAEHEPISARLLNNGVEPGWFLLALPLALFSPRKREVAVLALWFLIATVPLALLFPSMEARYQSPNVPALIGLTALALDGIGPRVAGLWQSRRVVTACGLLIVLGVVAGSHKVAISVMQHEVMAGQIHMVLGELDETYGRGNYAVLTAWPYTDFHYLRYVYPDLPVYTVHTIDTIKGMNLSQDLMHDTQLTYYPERMVLRPEQMGRLEGRVPVLFGFHENFAVANLRSIIGNIPGDPLGSQMQKMKFYDHLKTTWLWDNPAYGLEEVVKVGHYRAFEVRVPGGMVAGPTGDLADSGG